MNTVSTHYFALDLKDDPVRIAEYEAHHQRVWPEIVNSIKDSGITGMEIFRAGNRLFMILQVNESFTFEKKSEADRTNKRVQEWENLMWHYQQALPFAKPGEKWIRMKKIFDLHKNAET